MVLGCQANEAYAKHTVVLIYSIAQSRNIARPIKIFLLDAGLKASTIRRLYSLCNSLSNIEIHVIRPDPAHVGILNKLPLPNWQSVAAYYRLLLPLYIPDYYSRAIYMDVDVILKNDIYDLWTTDMMEYPLMAVPDAGGPTFGSRSKADFFLSELGLPHNGRYFNSGVMLIDLQYWRASNVTFNAIEVRQQAEHRLSHSDQDALNIVFAGMWGELDSRWNVVTSAYYTSYFLRHNYFALHFTGTNPAAHNCPHHEAPAFLDLFVRSEWYTKKEYIIWRIKQWMMFMKQKMYSIIRRAKKSIISARIR